MKTFRVRLITDVEVRAEDRFEAAEMAIESVRLGGFWQDFEEGSYIDPAVDVEEVE